MVQGDLELGECISLKSLPSGLEVGGDIVLRGCTSLSKELPMDLVVGGKVYPLNLYNT
jgi:hypothetical protein